MEVFIFCNGFFVSFFFLSYLNDVSTRPLEIASPNFQGSHIVGWNRTSYSDFLIYVMWEQGSKKFQKWHGFGFG